MQPFDCEALRESFPRQPINTWSSLAFVLVAVVLWRRQRRLAAGAVAVAGVGSVLFHGVPSAGSSLVHDVGLYAAVAVALLEVWRRTAAGRPPWAAGGVVALGLLLWATTRTGGPLCRPGSLLQGHAGWHGLAALAYLLTFLNGRSVPREAA